MSALLWLALGLITGTCLGSSAMVLLTAMRVEELQAELALAQRLQVEAELRSRARGARLDGLERTLTTTPSPETRP